jgi:hypothetical protein
MSEWLELSAQNSITPMNVELFLKVSNDTSDDVDAAWSVTLPSHLTKTTDKPLSGNALVKAKEDVMVGSWNVQVGRNVLGGNSEIVAKVNLVGPHLGAMPDSIRVDLSQLLSTHSNIRL